LYEKVPLHTGNREQESCRQNSTEQAGMLIVSEPHQLICALVPKCASTAIFKFFLDLSEFKTESNPRKFFNQNRMELQQKAGLSLVSTAGADLERFVFEHREFYWFSIVRDPYSRVLSNYHNKLNRVAYMFNRGAYYRGKLTQLMSGPSAWGNANRAAECMQKFLSFEEFVHSLRDHGIHFDLHFIPQYEFLAPAMISYNKLIRLERFGEGIGELLDSHNVKCSNLVENYPQQLNASAYKTSSDHFFTNETKDIVYELYRHDFEFLDYPR
jgi:hypothetical protein